MTDKTYDIILTILIWSTLWFLLEYFVIEGDVKETSVCLYIGSCLGYIMGVTTKKFTRKKNKDN